MTTASAAALARAWAHGPGKRVVAEPARPPAPEPRPAGAPWSVLPPGIAAVLRAALGPLSWDPWTRHNDHRAYPSVRPCRAHRAWLADGPRRWRLDPVRELLIGPGRPGPGATTVVLRPAPERLPAGYGPLRAALALLEVGHVAAALVSAGPGARAWSDGATTRVELAGSTPAPGRPPLRSSGVDPCGLALDPRPLPAAALAALVAARPPAGSITAGLTHRVAVRAVAGVADGAYAVAGGELRPHRVGRGIGAGCRIPAAALDACAVPVAWAVTADLAAAVRGGGAAAYPRLLVAAGTAAQHLGEAAARHGLFCRPVRAVDEPELEAALGCPPGEDLLCLLLIGRARATGLSYDLTAADADRGAR